MPHQTEILESQSRLKKIGTENWLKELKDFFLCLECKTVNSAYDLVCRKCGNTPVCQFVCRHKDLIEKYM
jgi:ribosomal protein L40E